MKYTKLLTFVLGIGITAGSLFMGGCHDETKKLDKCLAFAKTAGTTVGYVINTSAVALGPEIRNVIATITTAVVTELPTNVTAETIAIDLRTISTNVVHVAIPEIYEKHPELVDSTIDTLLGFLQMGLTSIEGKYPTEFGNAEMFYKISYAFFESVNVIVTQTNKVASDIVEQKLTIVPVTYEDIFNAAKADGNKILSKEDFEKLMTAIAK